MKKYRLKATIDRTFNALTDAQRAYCRTRAINYGIGYCCDECPLSYMRNHKDQGCYAFFVEHPDEAAELMGLETIEEIDEDCGLKTRSLVIGEI